MYPVQFTFPGELVAHRHCLGDGWAQERWLYGWPGPLESVRANGAGGFLVDQRQFSGRECLCGVITRPVQGSYLSR